MQEWSKKLDQQEAEQAKALAQLEQELRELEAFEEDGPRAKQYGSNFETFGHSP